MSRSTPAAPLLLTYQPKRLLTYQPQRLLTYQPMAVVTFHCGGGALPPLDALDDDPEGPFGRRSIVSARVHRQPPAAGGAPVPTADRPPRLARREETVGDMLERLERAMLAAADRAGADLAHETVADAQNHNFQHALIAARDRDRQRDGAPT